jgi:predicted dienelactone hydrolase
VSGLASKPLRRFLIGFGFKIDGDGLWVVWPQNHSDGFAGLASKPVVTVSSGLASKPAATVFSSLASKLVATVSLGLATKLVVDFLVEP